MKRIASIIGLTLSIAAFVNVSGQSNRKLNYYIELNQFITGSGFASGTEIYVKIDPDHKKDLAFGIFFCNEQKKITGITVHHEIMLLRKRSDHFIMPHIFYNFIYRKTSIPEVTADSKLTGDKASYTSMEHHAGMGVKMKITSSIYADCDLGYGAYLGSIKKPSLPDPLTGEISGTNGFGMIFKIGLGCYLF